MSQVVWTPIAEADLDDIIFYIAYVDHSPATGERIYYEIRDRVVHQAMNQLPGLRHPKASEGWFYLKHKRWLIFYRVQGKIFEVMRILDAVRDLPRLLRHP